MAEFAMVMKERERICKTFLSKSCLKCPLSAANNNSKIGCGTLMLHEPEEFEKIIMDWAAEHPAETMKDRFFKMFPNAPKNKDGTPQDICPQCLGWVDECADTEKCAGCWNRPYEERSAE